VERQIQAKVLEQALALFRRKGLGATEWTLIKIATAILVALLVYALWVSEKNLPWDQVLKWFK